MNKPAVQFDVSLDDTLTSDAQFLLSPKEDPKLMQDVDMPGEVYDEPDWSEND